MQVFRVCLFFKKPGLYRKCHRQRYPQILYKDFYNHLEHINISASSSQSEKTSALKEIEKIRKIIAELETWEREVLYPLAARQVEIDLDDGVKVNYPKLGSALKKVPGLS
jgi:hypothetical protein